MEKTKKTFRTWEPATVTLAGGAVIDILVKRLEIGESAVFDRLFQRAMTRESDRLLLARKPGEELAREVTSAIGDADLSLYAVGARLLRTARTRQEDVSDKALDALDALLQAVTPTERFVLADDEIRRRRQLELTDAERHTYDTIRKQDDAAFAACAEEAMRAYVKVVPGQIDLQDADTGAVSDVTTGADLARCMGADEQAIVTILLTIRAKNRLSDVEKNVSGSPSNSRSSSKACDPTVPGASPEETAVSVVPSVSVTSAGVTPTAASLSGAMAR